jgi:transposase
MPRTHGYALKGNRCYGTHDWNAKGRTNVIGALVGKLLLTMALLTGTTVNTDVFTSWVKQDLLPKLPPNAVIVMDNASFHKGKEMQQAIADAGHTLLYLPPYSPDLNNIEKKWSQCKKIRRATGCPVEEVMQRPDV